MKYIIIPLVKIIWALILTIMCGIATIISSIGETLWSLKFYKGIGFEPVELMWLDFDRASPFVKLPKYRGDSITYKTYFHYIWGIK